MTPTPREQLEAAYDAAHGLGLDPIWFDDESGFTCWCPCCLSKPTPERNRATIALRGGTLVSGE